jgi:hypothetical protein
MKPMRIIKWKKNPKKKKQAEHRHEKVNHNNNRNYQTKGLGGNQV